ncbi:hypothetical protein ACQE3E_08765 [Methylomonas sp. MED-D]|uniref:hypothetical protein n=1 Tax=Methylomonas sp. MED-D TaxID=3418768 RepID=UPI003D086ADA
MTEVINISKVDIASAQLDRAIQLYVDKTDLISAVTLAGAAEEILGKLVRDTGMKNAFDEVLDTLCAMHAAAFQEEPNRKVYAELRNGIRNEFKHLCAGKTLDINLDSEAAKLINRAIANYRKLFPGIYPRFREFEREWIERQA